MRLARESFEIVPDCRIVQVTRTITDNSKMFVMRMREKVHASFTCEASDWRSVSYHRKNRSVVDEHFVMNRK